MKSFRFIFLIIVLAGCSSSADKDDKLDGALELPGKRFVVDRLLKLRCLRGHGPSCTLVGRSLATNDEEKAAVNFYHMACNLNHGPGCYHAGIYDWNRKKTNQAFELLRKGCRYKSSKACYELAYWHLRKKSELQEFKRYIIKSCDYGLGSACKSLGELYYKEERFYKSYVAYFKACKLFDVGSCYNAGLAADKANAEKEMVESYKISCDRDFSQACYNLACFYSLKKERQLSFGFFEKSLEKGFDDWNHIEFDPDLKFLRQFPEFFSTLKSFRPPEGA